MPLPDYIRETWQNAVTAINATRLNNIETGLDNVTESVRALEASSYSGTGSPEGVVTAPPLSRYYQTDGVAGSRRWVKDSGTGNTGWVLETASEFEAPYEFAQNDVQSWLLGSQGVTLTGRSQRGTGVVSITVLKPLATAPRDLTDASWYQQTVTVTPNSVSDPDGTTLADTVTPSGLADSRIAFHDEAINAQNRTFRLAGYVRAATPHQALFNIIAFDVNFSVLDSVQVPLAVTSSWQYFDQLKAFGALTGATRLWCGLYPDNTNSTNLPVYAYNLQVYEAITVTSFPYAVSLESVVQLGASDVSGSLQFVLKGRF